ncbi:DUF411 domain-containing protein [Pseudovibrio sp. SPO723]|uniref:DUF411 domain-containing protein n=1 Tax=Nesiotobacter zosterae TaxID=392721 RepID=UPI0029C39F6A|nr:DUF411 domain-containing protein [Pseudovibrio sp. SPO723]MDX5593338.1 DUF411 domain-containing protein [Pseudovibrio sp. SPO723]
MTIKVSAAALAVGLFILPASHAVAQSLGEVHMHKSPYCGCCTDWADALSAAGYTVKTTSVENLDPIKQQAGIPDDLMSCHTATLNGYVLEGHVPLEAIAKLLEEKPEIRGLSVPGMPLGSLGMGEPDAETRYTVYAYGGKAKVPTPYLEVGK